jgi:hypothetical protein
MKPARHGLTISQLHQRSTVLLRQHLMDRRWIRLASKLVR